MPLSLTPTFQEQQYGVKQELGVPTHMDQLKGKGLDLWTKDTFPSSHMMTEIDKAEENLLFKFQMQ